jgi:hypothetical protein
MDLNNSTDMGSEMLFNTLATVIPLGFVILASVGVLFLVVFSCLDLNLTDLCTYQL